MSISELIFTNKKISKSLWDNDIHTLQYGRKNIEVILQFYVVVSIFYYLIMNLL